MKKYHKNPRQITHKQMRDLEIWLDELGDLSGVVHDLNSDEIVSGNQRMSVFDLEKAEIEISEKFDPPTRQGTVALGFVMWKGEKYSYRQVRWTPKQCEKANIIANKAGGTWDFDILANEFDVDELINWGFDEKELGFSEPTEEDVYPADPELEIGAELYERHDYIVLYFDNDFDWQVASELLQIKPVLCAPVGKKTIKQKGIGRVVNGRLFLELVQNGNKDL